MATNINFLRGEGDDRLLACSVYKLLRKGEVCTYRDFLKEYYSAKKNLEPATKLSNDPKYVLLKKAVKNVLDEIKRVVGEEAILKIGKTKGCTFQYVGKDPDPLKLLRDSKPKGLNAYLEFCRDSAGFIPEEWVLHFLKDSIALHDIHWNKERGSQGIVMSHSRELKNLEILPRIYEAIKNKTALRIEYSPFEGGSRVVWLSPHCLREFNGRWYVSGFKGRVGTTPYNLPLDRVITFEKVEGQYREAPANLYREWFDYLIGVARYKGAAVEDIVIRTHSAYIHGLVMTKPFHLSQKEIKPYGEHEDGTYGEIGLKVLLNPEDKNKEFRGKLLTFGSELEVMSPLSFRKELADEARKLWELYSK